MTAAVLRELKEDGEAFVMSLDENSSTPDVCQLLAFGGMVTQNTHEMMY